jgi:hypothetical protein
MIRRLRDILTIATSGRRPPPRRAGRVPRSRFRRLLFDTLEPRRLLHGSPVISELMAVNDGTLADKDGQFTDWIEVHNPGDAPVDLTGWYLTDNAANLTQWQFPAVTLDSREYLVVFASNKNLTDPAGELHTNFRLDGEGEYLALVESDGTTIVHKYAPFPLQGPDVSYGLARSGAETVLMEAGAAATAWVPTDGSLGSTWTDVGFDDTGWTSGTTGVGYDVSAGYDGLLGTDIEGSMFGATATAYVRVPFTVGDPAAIQTLQLNMKYDDGFVAYLNGNEIVNRNAPSTVAWDSAATAEHGVSTTSYLTQDFDAAGGTAYASGTYGSLPAATVISGGPDGSFLRLVHDGAAGNINRVSFDRELVGPAQRIVADFDFRLSSSDPNHPAEGFSFLLLPTAVYGDDGPGTVTGYDSEEPNLLETFAVGFDTSPELSGVNDVSVHFDGSQRLNVQLSNAQIDLDAGVFHRARIELVEAAGGMEVTITLTPDIFGTPGPPVTVVDHVLVSGLEPYESRVEFSGRTGTQHMDVDLDNIEVEFVPVPAVIEFQEIDISDQRDLLLPGENVLAIQGLNIDAGDDDFLVLLELVATEAIVIEGNPETYFATPTPGTLNGTTADAPSGPVDISPPGGLFTEATLTVELGTASPDAVIYYTLDGTIPNQSSAPYTDPLQISNSTQIRARAYEPGRAAGRVNTESYVKLGAGVQNFDSDLPIIVIDNFGAGSVPADWFQASQVFLFEPAADGWTHLTDGHELGTRAGLKTRGSSTRGQSYAFEAWFDQTDEDRDISPLGMPSESDWILYSSVFDDSLMNNSFMYELSNRVGPYAVRTHHVEYFLNTGGDQLTMADHKGVFVFMEKIKRGPDRVDVEQLDPGDNTQPDISGGYMFKIDRVDPGGDSGFTAGNQALKWVYPKEDVIETPEYDAQENWIKNYLNEYYAAVSAADFVNPSTGLHYSEYFDVPAAIDHHILNEFSKNPDEFVLSTYLYKPRNEKFTYGPIWDFDRALGFETRSLDPLSWYKNMRWGPWFGNMFRDADFSQMWIDRWFELRQNQLSHANMLGIVDSQEASLAYSQRNNSAWPTYVTRLETWIDDRLTWIDGRFRPLAEYSRGSGKVVPGTTVTFVNLPASGDIYYTTDGTDPRASGGGIRGQRYDGTPITVNDDTKIVARVYDVTATASTYGFTQVQWGAPSELVLVIETPADANNVAITEVNYHPPPPTPAELAVNAAWTASDFEYIELLNTSGDTITLFGTHFVEGIQFAFDATHPHTLAAGDRMLLVANPTAFAARYGSLPNVLGPFDTGSLSNSGETIQWLDINGRDISAFTYGDSGGWPGRADGKGATLEVIDVAGDYNDPDNFNGSIDYGGSPGAAGSEPLGIVINEVLTHTDLPAVDSIELHNTTDAPLNIGGWYLSDSWGWDYTRDDGGDYKKYQIPTTDPQGRHEIPVGGYVVFDESDFNASGDPDNDFALDGAHGDEVWLMKADDQGNLIAFADNVDFGAAANGESFGLWPNGDGVLYPMVSHTLGMANSGPRVGPLVISEVMYHPTLPTPEDLAVFAGLTQDDLEFVEIYNPTSEPVPLTNWRIRGGISYDFASGTTLADDAALVILPFNPNKRDALGQLVNAERTNAFRRHYDISASVALVGGYSGQLDNGGERVRLQRPDEPPLDEPDFIPHLLEDEVRYDDVDPWPTLPDGGGQSLSRYPVAEWGHAAASWGAAVPAPGEAGLQVFAVNNLTPTIRGFVAQFDRKLDPSALNLYGAQDGALGPADVTVVGNSVGPVAGSLLFDTQSVTFVARGGPLPMDTYTVTLRSGEDAFQGLSLLEVLDGNGDGVGGDDYVGTFRPAPVGPVLVSLTDFMRGPGQPVDVPAAPSSGLPIHVSDADGVRTIDVVLIYDPALLNITDVAVGPDMPADATAQINWFRNVGQSRWVSMTFRTSTAATPPPLPPGPADFMSIIADVPATAAFGTSQILRFLVVSINDPPLVDPIAASTLASVQAVGFLGDTTGNQSYSGLDAQRAARVAVGLDSGFVAYANFDPVIVADVTGNGSLSGLDAQRIALEAVGLGADEIPPIPQALRLADPERRMRSAHQIAGDDTDAASGAQSAPYGLRLAVPDRSVRSAHQSTAGNSGAQSAPYGLDDAQLAPVVDAAMARIESLAPDAAAKLQDVQFQIVDLPDNLLGLTVGNTIRIDVDAAGYGWFVEKYEGQRTKDEGRTTGDEAILDLRPSPFVLRPSVDLLTVVMHELGHVLGLDHHESGLMDDTLSWGARWMPGDEFDWLAAENETEAQGNLPVLDATLIREIFSNEI